MLHCCFSPQKFFEHFSKKKKKNIMNEALNIRISATRATTSNSVSSPPLPLNSHVHLVSVRDSPTAFLFAHFVHECIKIQFNDENEDDDFDDENNNDYEDTKNETTATTKTSGLMRTKTKTKRATVVFVETSKPFETSISPHLRRKKAEFLYKKKEKFGIESIDCWSKPMAFNTNDDDDKEEDKKEENMFTVNGARSSSTSSLDGLYDLIAKNVSSSSDDIGTMEECSRNGGASIFIDSLDVLAARTSEKAVVRFLVRLRAMENVALVTGCQAAEDVEDGFLDEDDRERGTMQLLIENLADMTLTTSKLPSEGGNKGELVKVVTRHRTVDSKYLDWDGSVVDGNRTLLDEENGGSRRPGGKFSHVTAGVSGRNFDDDDDGELTFSLTTECVATISELGAKCERYSFSL